MLKQSFVSVWGWSVQQFSRREGLARIAIILLSLSACWGVYHFGALIVPGPVAMLGAAAFESAYIGLAYLDLSGDRQQRARRIGLTAVTCSVTFNVLSGLIHLQPALFEQPPLIIAVGLAVIHSVPLSWLAYQLADLVIHSPPTPAEPALDTPAPATTGAATIPLLPDRTAGGERRFPCPRCQEPLTQGEYGAAVRRNYCRHCKAEVPAAADSLAA